MKGTRTFEPVARLQYLLSEELVSDPNVAIMEFVKNGYDADATKVVINFEFGDTPADSEIAIWDDGSGMDLATFERNWLRPGYSGKSEISETSRSRVPVGEKGLGRLAAGRLGERLDLYTRRRAQDPWLHVSFRWKDFDDKETPLTKIPIDIDDETDPPVTGLAKGTIVVISDLKMRWNARLPGRRPKGRATTRINRLREELEVLMLPLLSAGHEFTVEIEHDSDLPEDEEGEIDPRPLELLDYEYHFEVAETSKGWRIKRRIRRGDAVRGEIPELKSPDLTADLDELPIEVDMEACGPVKGSFFYATPKSANRLAAVRAPIGVRVYRDDVRIDPFGDDEDDWLNAFERKAVRQGHAAIQPKALYGAIQISKSSNPDLRPLANREGLINNEAYDAFIAVARHEFDTFGKTVEDEYLEPKWERQQAKKIATREFNARQWALAMSRATAHAIRQPLTAAGAELSQLRRTISDSPGLPSSVRAELAESHDHVKGHIDRVEVAISRMLETLNVDPAPREIDLVELCKETMKIVRPDARTAGVKLVNNVGADRVDVLVSPGLIEQALEAILENAIHADRPAGRKGEVTLQLEQDPVNVRIIVTDNGSGVSPDIQAQLFKQTVSQRGRIGVGLLFNRQLLQIAHGELELVETNDSGSRFDLVVPLRPLEDK